MLEPVMTVKRRSLALIPLLAILTACGDQQPAANTTSTAPAPTANTAADTMSPISNSQRIAGILDSQTEDVKVRYGARHPAETLQFFGIEPGMVVVETDPGSGWYSRILHAYLGEEGTLIGADYALEMYPLFEYYSEEALAAKATWHTRWPAEIATGSVGAKVSAYNLGGMPESLDGTVDAFLFVRSLHNLVSFEAHGDFATTAIAEAFRALKPGGIVGVVQHMGPETHSDEWASGGNGYLKRSAVIAMMERGGFVLDGESDVNLNPADQPSEEEYVWRLPPTAEDPEDPVLASKYQAIGESNRMTLRFVKPTRD